MDAARDLGRQRTQVIRVVGLVGGVFEADLHLVELHEP